MNEDRITLTDIDVDRCMSVSGGFKSEVIRLLGEDVTVKGWRNRLRGRVLPRRIYEDAQKLANLPKLRNIPHGEAKGQIALF